MNKCSEESHTAYQPTDEEWKCLRCGSGGENGIYIDGNEGEFRDCQKLHKNDLCECFKCGYTITGAVLAERLLDKAKKAICPTCQGRGVIPGGV